MSIQRVIALFVIVMGCSLFCRSQATRTWVSGVGDDANPCSRTAPCKTFAGAISKTATNGEINCIDPGGFGAVTIMKSITIDCTGTFGSILGAGTNGININLPVGDARQAVRLRGLSLDGAATGLNGIRVMSDRTNVTIENVVIDGFNQAGLSVESGAYVLVKNTSIRGNGIGVSVMTRATVALTQDLITANITGILNKAGSVLSYKDNVIDGNSTNGNVTPAVLQ